MAKTAVGFKTPSGQVSFPHLFVPRQRGKDNPRKRYSVTLVFPSEKEIAGVIKATKAWAKEKLGKIPTSTKFVWPWHPGTDQQDDDGNQREGFSEDCVYIEFWRYEDFGRMAVVGPNPDRAPLEASEAYAGCRGRVWTNPSYYDYEGKKGISLHLEAFQKTGEGTPIGSGPPPDADDVFDDDDGDAVDFASDDDGDDVDPFS